MEAWTIKDVFVGGDPVGTAWFIGGRCHGVNGRLQPNATVMMCAQPVSFLEAAAQRKTNVGMYDDRQGEGTSRFLGML